jgi:hypothetical protein
VSRRLAWFLFVVSIVGFGVTFPLWLTGRISERAMLGITLALSWAALWYEALNGIRLAKAEAEREE